MSEKKRFEYTYTAPTEQERREAEEIRKRYAPITEQESKLAQLKSLDAKVKKAPMIWALTLGILGTLIFGGGLSIILETEMLIVGMVVSVVGLVPITLAYFVHRYLMERGKKKYGAEILRLSEEILSEK